MSGFSAYAQIVQDLAFDDANLVACKHCGDKFVYEYKGRGAKRQVCDPCRSALAAASGLKDRMQREVVKARIRDKRAS